MEYKDLSFSIDNHLLSGDYQIAKQNQEYCLSSPDNSHKWCWDPENQHTSLDTYQGGWKLEDLLYKFNFEDLTYFPENFDSLSYQMNVNKKSNNGCSLIDTDSCARGVAKVFDLIGVELI